MMRFTAFVLVFVFFFLTVTVDFAQGQRGGVKGHRRGQATTGHRQSLDDVVGDPEILENGAGKFKIDIQEAPVASANVESITVEDLVIDEREMTTGADWDYRVYGPGDAHYGSVTIQSRVSGGVGGELPLWWQQCVKSNQQQQQQNDGPPRDGQWAPGRGQDCRKDITVNIIHRDIAVRTWKFLDCEVTEVRPFELTKDGVAVETAVCQPNGVRLEAIDLNESSSDSLFDNGSVGVVKSQGDVEVKSFASLAFGKEGESTGQWTTFNGGGVRVHQRGGGLYASEFSRTLTANSGEGSDHAWGGNYCRGAGDNGGYVTCQSQHLSVGSLTLGGNALVFGQSELHHWITATIQGNRAPQYKDITISHVRTTEDGRTEKGNTVNYLECFLTQYKFPALSASGTGNLYEEIAIKPIRLELA